MRIVVEGPDGAGKTSLIKMLAEKFDFEVIVNDKGPDQNFEWWWPETLILKGSAPDHTVIHDRFFYSELVYGPIIRGSLAAPEDLIRTVRRELRLNALLIYARPALAATLFKGMSVEKQMEGVTNRFTELIEAYDNLMWNEGPAYGRRYYVYDWEAPGEPRSVVEHVKRFLRGELV